MVALGVQLLPSDAARRRGDAVRLHGQSGQSGARKYETGGLITCYLVHMHRALRRRFDVVIDIAENSDYRGQSGPIVAMACASELVARGEMRNGHNATVNGSHEISRGDLVNAWYYPVSVVFVAAALPPANDPLRGAVSDP